MTTRSPEPAEGQVWECRATAGRTITITSVAGSWTKFTEDTASAYTGAPAPGCIPTRGLLAHYRLVQP